MDWLFTFITVMAGILIRLGLPLAITAAMVWVLLKLDQRWQSEQAGSDSKKVKNRGCWDIKNCPEELQRSCPARARIDTPCWQVNRQPGGLLKEDCLNCKVFREAEVPVT